MSQTITQHGGTQRIKMLNKLDALEKLGRYLGMFVDRHVIEDERIVWSVDLGTPGKANPESD